LENISPKINIYDKWIYVSVIKLTMQIRYRGILTIKLPISRNVFLHGGGSSKRSSLFLYHCLFVDVDPSNSLAIIHHRYRQTDRHERQRSDSMGWIILQTVTQWHFTTTLLIMQLKTFCWIINKSVLFLQAGVQPTLDPCAEAFWRQAHCASPGGEELWRKNINTVMGTLSVESRFAQSQLGPVTALPRPSTVTFLSVMPLSTHPVPPLGRHWWKVLTDASKLLYVCLIVVIDHRYALPGPVPQAHRKSQKYNSLRYGTTVAEMHSCYRLQHV